MTTPKELSAEELAELLADLDETVKGAPWLESVHRRAAEAIAALTALRDEAIARAERAERESEGAFIAEGQARVLLSKAIEALEAEIAWNEERAKQTPDAFEDELHRIVANRLRAALTRSELKAAMGQSEGGDASLLAKLKGAAP